MSEYVAILFIAIILLFFLFYEHIPIVNRLVYFLRRKHEKLLIGPISIGLLALLVVLTNKEIVTTYAIIVVCLGDGVERLVRVITKRYWFSLLVSLMLIFALTSFLLNIAIAIIFSIVFLLVEFVSKKLLIDDNLLHLLIALTYQML